MMDRREAIRLLGASAAFAGLSPEQLTALVERGRPAASARIFFTEEQRRTVDALADAILPATDTPGALDAGVTDFIEVIVSEWYEEEERARFVRELAHLDEHAVTLAGVPFAGAAEEHRHAILSGLEAEGEALLRSRSDGDRESPRPFFHRVRSLVLHGYYTSEVGMREELLFRRLPGRFEGCVDVTLVTRPRPEAGRG